MLKRAPWFGLAALLLVSSIVVASQGCQATCVLPTDCPDGQFCSMGAGNCATPQALGFCRPVPAAGSCPVGEIPICGCDGKTYPSACEASILGFSVLTTGACNTTCGTPGTSCPQGQFCPTVDGTCGATGAGTSVCEPVPTTCAGATPGEVCGCDGKTYPTRCAAEVAGVSIQAPGACPCGGAANAKCAAGKFCDLAVGTCGGVNPTGTCTAPPTSCVPFGTLVCGCDGKTYNSACEASKAKVSLLSMGGCPCGGFEGAMCPANDYCDFGAVGGCLGPNATGSCKPRPTSCINNPGNVCGCDGQQYTNACEAAQGGTSVAFAGACPMIPDAGTD